jgi:alcohol dehydrogenase YqhD (iron-dependent ADH family)
MLAENVWDIREGNVMERALTGIKKLKEFWKSIGLPVTFEELGGKEEDIPYLAKNVNYDANGIIGNFMPLSETDVLEIFKLMK